MYSPTLHVDYSIFVSHGATSTDDSVWNLGTTHNLILLSSLDQLDAFYILLTPLSDISKDGFKYKILQPTLQSLNH